MSAKKVSIGNKPTKALQPESADEWVENRTVTVVEPERMKRLTIDIPEELHREIKSQCAMRGTKIADELRTLLAEHYKKSVK